MNQFSFGGTSKILNFDYQDGCIIIHEMANGMVTGSNGKIGSAHMLPARISEELEEVFSTRLKLRWPAETMGNTRGSP